MKTGIIVNIHLLSVVLLMFTVMFEVFVYSENLLVNLRNPDFIVNNSVTSKIVIVPIDFQSIQEAINNVTNGTVILVKTGVYYGGIVINKSITLLGEEKDSTIIDSNGSSDVITVLSNSSTICGFTIRNGGTSYPANCGIKLCNVDNNIICNNTITGNFVGIKLGDKQRGSKANIIKYNNITGNRYGIFLDHASLNEIYGNLISKNLWNGIELAWSNNNKIYNNTICCNKAYGLEIPIATPSINNILYHNNFINNTLSTSTSGYKNIWDDGYPSGGNYWSDYKGVDEKFGVHQNINGCDSIGDSPHIIDANNVDSYPLTSPFKLLIPVAIFVFSPENPKIGEPVTLNASLTLSDGATITSYYWDFGDGNTAVGQIVKHTYLSAGKFTASLNVTNCRGLSAKMTKTIAIQNPLNCKDVTIKLIVIGALTGFIIFFSRHLWKRRTFKVSMVFEKILYKFLNKK
jgi:parallel beta-helix repeat protein